MNQLEPIAVLSAAAALSFALALAAQWALLRAMFHLLPNVAPRPRHAAAPGHARRIGLPVLDSSRVTTRVSGVTS